MNHNDKRQTAIGRYVLEQLLEGVEAPGRRSDSNHRRFRLFAKLFGMRLTLVFRLVAVHRPPSRRSGTASIAHPAGVSGGWNLRRGLALNSSIGVPEKSGDQRSRRSGVLVREVAVHEKLRTSTESIFWGDCS